MNNLFSRCVLPYNQASVYLDKTVSEEKIFKKSTNQKEKLPVVAMVITGSGQNVQSLQRTFNRCFLPSFGSFGQAVSEEKIFYNRRIRNNNCLRWPCLLTDRDEMCNLHREHFIDASYQVLVYLTKTASDEKIFKNQPIKNKNCRRRLKCEKLTENE